MSYSRFHYIESALEEIDSRLFSYSKNERYNLYSIGFVYLAFLVSQNNKDYDISLKDCFEEFELSENFKTVFEELLQKFFDKKLTAFKDVSIDEMKEFIIEADKNLNQDFIRTPWGVCSLSNMILDLKDTDDVLNMCCWDGTYIFNTLNNYDVHSLDGKGLNYQRNAMIEIMATIQGFKVNINTENMFDYIEYDNLPETYDKNFSMIPWGMQLSEKMEEYAKEKKIHCPKSDSQPLFIHSILDHLSKEGKAVVCVNNTMLSITSSGIQEFLVENGYLESVIQLAPNLLNVTTIPFSLFVLSHNNKSVRFVNATNIYTPARRGKNELSVDDIASIFELYTTDSKFSISISNDIIKDNDYKLLTANYLFKPRLNYKGIKEYIKLENLCTSPIFRGIQFKSDELDNNDTKIPTDNYYLNVAGIKENEICSELPNLLEIDEKAANCCLKENDIVMSVPISTSPKVAVVSKLGKKKILVASNLYIIRVDSSKINPQFLKILFESRMMTNLIYTFNQGVMLSVDFLKGLEIPILPLDEQNLIVENYNNIKIQINSLKQAIINLEQEKANIISGCLGDIE